MFLFICKLYIQFKYRFVDKDLCMCGASGADHCYTDNHSFVGAFDYTVEKETYWFSVGGRL